LVRHRATVILRRSEIRTLKPYGSAAFQTYQEAEEDGSGDAAAGGAESPVFFTIMLALLASPFQLFLVVGKQSMNLAVRFVADSVNLREQAPVAKLPDSYRPASESYRGAPQAEAGPAASVPESTPDPS